MRFFLALACSSLLFPPALAVRAQDTATETRSTETRTLDSLPAEVRALMRERFGRMGDADAPLARYCVIGPGEWRQRFQGADVSADRITVRIERGGRSNSSFAIDYALGRDGWQEVTENMSPEVARMKAEPERFRLTVPLGPTWSVEDILSDSRLR